MKHSPQLSSSPTVTVFSIQAHSHQLLGERAVEEARIVARVQTRGGWHKNQV
jgi:hypothetical protein